MTALPLSLLSGILRHRSLRLEGEDGLYDFISEGLKTNRELFSLLEFVIFEYCSMDVMNDYFDLLSQHFYEINASVWAGLRARLVLPHTKKRLPKHFSPSVKKVKTRDWLGTETEMDYPTGSLRS
jgi:hypothetical protein